MRRIARYIHEQNDWPSFTWKLDAVLPVLSEVRFAQGRLLGRMAALGFMSRAEATLEVLTLDVVKTSEIEGETLNAPEVRSSIARRLGMDIAGAVPSDRFVDGIVDMMTDATQRCEEPVTQERLFGWHAALFPTGRSGMFKIPVGDWRTDANGPVQVVSGAMGKETVHFEAPEAARLPVEMNRFITWINEENLLDPVLKAAVAHLWFITLHPFEDGNGRIARALTDLLLARSEQSPQRFYSMSAQISARRNAYYSVLEQTRKGELDVTGWMVWFLNCLLDALNATGEVVNRVLYRADFWNRHAQTVLNPRQKKVLDKLLDAFEGKLTSSKWAKITKCSSDTAIRDINSLVAKGILQKEEAGGRSTAYVLKGS
jgi:Fic family protein